MQCRIMSRSLRAVRSPLAMPQRRSERSRCLRWCLDTRGSRLQPERPPDRLSYTWTLYRSTSCRQKLTPRTEFPEASSRGEKVANPIRLGTTTMTDPATPDLAGRPTSNVNRPALSYMPAACMTEMVLLTISAESTWRPLMGQTPPFASVAAAMDSIRAVISMLQDER